MTKNCVTLPLWALSYFCDSPKKINGKSCPFFLLFLNMRMEGWGPLFAVRLRLVWSGGGRSGQTCLNFIRGTLSGAAGSKIGAKLYMLHATFWLLFCWNILVQARYEVGEKSNKCNQCDYASSHAFSLRRHMKMHTREKSYKCNQCDHASSHTSNLKAQMKTQTGEK